MEGATYQKWQIINEFLEASFRSSRGLQVITGYFVIHIYSLNMNNEPPSKKGRFGSDALFFFSR